MANRRISELKELLNTQLATSDLLVVYDGSDVETKKITVDKLKSYLISQLTSSIYGTSSYSNLTGTSSYLSYNGEFNGSASYAMTCSNVESSSYSDSSESSSYSDSASFTLSSSYGYNSYYCVSASYAQVASAQYTVSSAFASSSATSSYLVYIPGINNGTASNALTSSWSANTKSSSFLIYTGKYNGTASNSLTSSWSGYTKFLYYNGVTPNGTASYALKAATATTATTVTTITNEYIYRELNPATASISNNDTLATFGYFQVTGSTYNPKVIMEAYGDVKVPMSSSIDYSCSLEFYSENVYGKANLDKSSFQHYYTQSYLEPSGALQSYTASIICPFYLKGLFVVSGPSTQRVSSSILANNGLTFYTGSRKVMCTIKTNVDQFSKE